jgi:hypothetical protein
MERVVRNADNNINQPPPMHGMGSRTKGKVIVVAHEEGLRTDA